MKQNCENDGKGILKVWKNEERSKRMGFAARRAYVTLNGYPTASVESD
jgi:hypothetical protein